MQYFLYNRLYLRVLLKLENLSKNTERLYNIRTKVLRVKGGAQAYRELDYPNLEEPKETYTIDIASRFFKNPKAIRLDLKYAETLNYQEVRWLSSLQLEKITLRDNNQNRNCIVLPRLWSILSQRQSLEHIQLDYIREDITLTIPSHVKHLSLLQSYFQNYIYDHELETVTMTLSCYTSRTFAVMGRGCIKTLEIDKLGDLIRLHESIRPRIENVKVVLGEVGPLTDNTGVLVDIKAFIQRYFTKLKTLKMKVKDNDVDLKTMIPNYIEIIF